MRRAVQRLFLLLVLAVPWQGVAQNEPPVPKELRERFGAWAEHYPLALPGYTALETVRRTRFDRKGRPSEERAATFRYTLRRSPENPREWMESREPVGTGAGGRAAKVEGDAGAGYFSKVALLVTNLATRYHDRVRYFFEPELSDVASDYVVVGYRQFEGEGLMEVDGKAVYVSGRAWVDPDDGSIAHIEQEFADKKNDFSIAVDFTRDPATQVRLPVRAIVRVFDKHRLESQTDHSYSEILVLAAGQAAGHSPAP